MARTRGSLVLLALLVPLTLPATGRAEQAARPIRMKVMTFNVLCSFCKPSEYGPWKERLTYVADLLHRHDPDLVGLQELATAKEVEQFKEILPTHEAVYYSKGNLVYPDATILYRRDRFELMESGAYWLSRTPDRPLSKGWKKGLQVPRLVVWATLKHRPDGRRVFFVNTHFDANRPNQRHSAPLLLKRTAQRAADLPIIVVGDFNAKPESKAYEILTSAGPGDLLLRNTYDLAEERRHPTKAKTLPPYDPAGRIDHLFVGGAGTWSVKTWTVDRTVYGPKKRFPSDHRAMVAELVLGP